MDSIPSTIIFAPYYDRGATLRKLEYSAVGVAPHVDIVRDSNTPASGKRVLLSHFYFRIRRATAAAVLGLVTVQFRVDFLIALKATLNDNTVGAEKIVALGSNLVMPTGLQFDLRTDDLSTGGTVDYDLYVAGTEFNTER